MLFRIFAVIVVLAGCYAGWRLWNVQSFYHSLRDPAAGFTVTGSGNQSALTIVEFLNYNCLECRQTHLALLDYAQSNKDVRLVIRPVPFEASKEEAERALAAGLQGKFAEMDRAMADYGADYDEKFYREVATLHEIDYERLLEDAGGDEVYELAADNAEAALRSGVTSTPALWIGKTLYQPKAALTVPDIIRMVRAEGGK